MGFLMKILQSPLVAQSYLPHCRSRQLFRLRIMPLIGSKRHSTIGRMTLAEVFRDNPVFMSV